MKRATLVAICIVWVLEIALYVGAIVIFGTPGMIFTAAALGCSWGRFRERRRLKRGST